MPINPLTRTLNTFVAYLFECQGFSRHDCTNFRRFLDGKVLTHRMPYIDTVLYYWRKICIDEEFILSVTFLTLIYLKDYQDESL